MDAGATSAAASDAAESCAAAAHPASAAVGSAPAAASVAPIAGIAAPLSQSRSSIRNSSKRRSSGGVNGASSRATPTLLSLAAEAFDAEGSTPRHSATAATGAVSASAAAAASAAAPVSAQPATASTARRSSSTSRGVRPKSSTPAVVARLYPSKSSETAAVNPAPATTAGAAQPHATQCETAGQPGHSDRCRSSSCAARAVRAAAAEREALERAGQLDPQMEACSTDAERAALRASRERVAGITAAAQAEAVARLHKCAAEHEAWLAAERQKRLDDEVAELGQFKRKPRASSAARPAPPAPGSNGAAAAAAGSDAQAIAAPASSGETGSDPAAPALPYGTTLYYRSLVEAEAHAAQMRAIAQSQYSFRPAINARSARMARKSNAKIAAAIAAASAGEKSSSAGAVAGEEKTQLHQTDRAAPVKPRIVDSSSRPNQPQLRVSKPLRSSSSASSLGSSRASSSVAAGAVYSAAPSAYKMKTLEKHAKDASKEMTFRPKINPPLARAHNGIGHASAAVAAASKPAVVATAAVAAGAAVAPATPSPAAFQRSSSASPSPSGGGGPSSRDFLHVPPSFDLFDSPRTLLARPLSTLKESHSWSAGEFQLAREELGGTGLSGGTTHMQPHRRALSTETWSLSPAAAATSSFAAGASPRARLSLQELEEALRPQSARNASSSPSPSSLGRSTPRAGAGLAPEQLSARSASTTTGTPRRTSSSPRAETERAHSASLSGLSGPGTGSASGSGSGSGGASRPFLATHVSSRLHGWAEAQAERRGRDRRTAEERALALCTFAPQLNPPFPSGRSPSSGRGRGRGKHYALPLERAQRIAQEWISAAEVAAAAAAAAGPARPSDPSNGGSSGGSAGGVSSPSASGAPAIQSRVLSSRSLMHAASLAPEVHALGHHLVRQERARLLRREEELIRQGAARAGVGAGAAAAHPAAAAAAGAGRRSSSRNRPPAPTSAFSVAVASYGSRGYAHLHGSGLPQVDSPSPSPSPARAMTVPGAAKNAHVHHGAPAAWSAEDGANGALALGWSSPVCVDADADADAEAGEGAAADAGSPLDSVDVSSSDASPTLVSSSVSAGQGRPRPAPLLTPGGGRGRAELLSPGSTLQQLCDLNLGTVVGTPSPMQSAREDAGGNGAGAAGPAMMFPASPAPGHADSSSVAASAADMVFPALRGGEDHAGEDDGDLGRGPDSELHPPAESPPRLPSPKEQWEAGVLLERLRLEQARLAQLGRGADAAPLAPVSQTQPRAQQTAQWERRPRGEVQQQQQQQHHSSPQSLWAHTSPQHPPQHFLSPQQNHSPPMSAAPLPVPVPAPASASASAAVPLPPARRSLLQSSLAAVVSNLPNLDALLHRTMLREMQQHSSLEEAGFTFLGSKPASSLPQPSFDPPLVLVPVSAVASPAMRNRGAPGSSPWGSPGPSALSTPSLSAANAPLFATLAAHAPLPPSPLASLARLGPSSALQFGVPWPVEERRDAVDCAPAYGGGDAADAVESAAHENGATVRRDAELQQQQPEDEGEDENEQDDASVSVGSDVEEDDGAEEEDERQEQIDVSSGDSDDDGDEAEEQR